MLKRLIRLILLSAAAAGVVYIVRSLRRDTDPLPTVPEASDGEPWPTLRPEPAPSAAATPPATAPAAAAPAGPAGGTANAAWVEATVDGDCPAGYPIKANMSSKIFHSPGQLAYDRTQPDRCYATAEAAEADGLRAAKR